MFNIDALNISDPLWESENLGLREGRCREPATISFPDHWRVQALFNHGPNRERGSEVIATNSHVGAITYSNLMDLREQLIGSMLGKDVGNARLDSHTAER
ncbi:unannotated protein [freshwater metagenome]|uniref:Unannotated protein n=1 Tax=freshwater metagenome TaxID=449393 RepID=A0A6J6Y256_9ZZZZ